MLDLARSLGDSQVRRSFLGGFLDFRAALRETGIPEGFQWVDGSFVEDTARHDREPRDIDVVTFFRLPVGQTEQAFFEQHAALVERSAVKAVYHVDSFFVPLDTTHLRYFVRQVALWNTLWSHTRELEWKGYLEVDLLDPEDSAAKALVATASQGVVQ